MSKLFKAVIIVIIVLIAIFSANSIFFKIAAIAGTIVLAAWIFNTGYFWKAFFIFYCAVYLAGMLLKDENPSGNIFDYVHIISFPFETIGLYRFVFKKKFWKPWFWQIVFFLSLLIFFGSMIFWYDELMYKENVNIYIMPFAYLFASAISFPLYYALYRNAFEEKKGLIPDESSEDILEIGSKLPDK